MNARPITNTASLRNSLETAMQARQGCGEDSTYEDHFVALNDELYKLEGLNQNPVNWPQVEQLAMVVLTELSTDLSAVIYWTRAAAETQGSAALLDGISTLNWLLKDHADHAWPRRKRRREAAFGWAARHFLPALRKLTGNDSLLDEITTELTTLGQRISEQLPNVAEHVNVLREQLPTPSVNLHVVSGTEPQPEAPVNPTISPIDLSGVETPALDNLTHASSEQRLQAVVQFAVYWIEQKPAEPAGYQVLRQALWDDIDHIPGNGPKGRMPLMPVPAEREDRYREALGQPSITSIVQLEQSLAKSPFWLTGHFLQATQLAALGHQDAASCILQCASDWLQRMPGLDNARFANDSPVISEEVAAWLASKKAAGSSSGADFNYEDRLLEACENADESGVLPALTTLQSELLQAASPRSRFLHLLTLAAFCERQEQPVLACNALVQISQIASAVKLSAWEPELLEHVHQLSAKLKQQHPALPFDAVDTPNF